MSARDMVVRYIVELQDKGTAALLSNDKRVRSSLSLTGKALDQQKRSLNSTADVATRAAIAQARAALSVEKAQNRAGRAVDRFGRDSIQARSAAVRLTEAQHRLEVATRKSGDAAERAASKQRAAASKQAASASRGSNAAAGAAGGLASRGAALAGAAGLGVGLVSVTKNAVGFEKQMSAVQARLGATKGAMKGLSGFAIDLGSKTSFSAREAAGAMDILATQGFKTKEIFKTLPGTLSLAAASGTDLATAADVQTSALRGFGLGAKQAARVADVLAEASNRSAADVTDFGTALPYVAATARKTGTSFEQVAAMLGVLRNAGLDASTAGTALRTSMLRLTDPSKKMQDVLSGIGLNARQLAGTPLPKVIGQIADKIKGLPRGQQLGVVSAVFGKEAAPTILTLLSKGRKGIDDLTRSLQNSRGASEKTAKVMRDNVAGAWDNFTGSVEAASIKLTRRFLPVVKNALNAGARGVTAATNVVSRVAPEIGAGLSAGLRGRSRSEVAGLPAASRVAADVGRVARTIGTGAVAAGKQLVSAFKPALPFLKNVLLPLLKGVAEGVIGGLVASFKVAVPIIKVVATVLGTIGKAARPLKGVIEGVGKVLGFVFGPGVLGKVGAFLKGFGRIGSVVGKAASLAGGAMSRVLGVGRKAMGGLVDAVRPVANVFGRVFGAVGKAISSGVGAVSRGAGRIVSAIGGLIGKAGSAMGRVVGRIVSVVKGLPGKIKDALVGIGGAVASIGRGIADWLNEHTPLGDQVKAGPIHFRLPALAAGGVIDAAQALVSPGELLVAPGGQSAIVPGRRVAADNVLATVPAGTKVFTDHGQSLLAAGATLGQAMAAQLPHFREGGTVYTPGQMAGLAYTAGGVRPKREAVRMGAIGMRESKGRANAHNYDPPRDDSWGLWQINVLPNANPRFASWRLTDPKVNARAMGILHRAGGERPWGGYPESSFSGYLAAAARGFTTDVSSGAGGSFRLSKNVTGGGFAAGYDAGAAGATGLRGISGVGQLLRSAQVKARQASSPGGGSRTDASAASTRTGLGTFDGRQVSRWVVPILDWARSHGWRGRLTSGYRSPAHNAEVGGAAGSNHTKVNYPGGAVDVGGWGARAEGSALNAVLRRYPRKPNLVWAGPTIGDWGHFSATGHRRGGVVQRLRAGGMVTGSTRQPTVRYTPLTVPLSDLRAAATVGDAGNTAVKAALNRLTGLLDNVGRFSYGRIAGFASRLERQIQQLRKGDETRREDVEIRRLQVALRLARTEMGRRTGRLVQSAFGQQAVGAGITARTENMFRLTGIDASSTRGLGMQIATATEAMRPERRAVQRLLRAQRRAYAQGSDSKAREIGDQLKDARGQLFETYASRAELRRQRRGQRAQDRVDRAQQRVDIANAGSAAIDAQQRLMGTTDTAAGMRQKADQLTKITAPALQKLSKASFGMAARLEKAGDRNGAVAAFTAGLGYATDATNALADAADNARAATTKILQDSADNAGHTFNMATIGYEGLQADERLAGTTDSTGPERADYIEKNIIPAIAREIDADAKLWRDAIARGDTAAANAIQETIGGLWNDAKTWTAEAKDQRAAMIDNFKEFGGTIGFDYSGQRFTDLLSAGAGV